VSQTHPSFIKIVAVLYTVSGKKGTDSTLDITLTNSNNYIVLIFARNVVMVM